MQSHTEECKVCNELGYPEDFVYLGDGNYLCPSCMLYVPDMVPLELDAWRYVALQDRHGESHHALSPADHGQ